MESRCTTQSFHDKMMIKQRKYQCNVDNVSTEMSPLSSLSEPVNTATKRIYTTTRYILTSQTEHANMSLSTTFYNVGFAMYPMFPMSVMIQMYFFVHSKLVGFPKI